MRGSFKQNEEYCSKESKLTKYGPEPTQAQGERNDINNIYDLLKEGKRDLEIIEATSFGAYSRTLRAQDRVRMLLKPRWEKKRQIILIHGDPGVGKTSWAYEQFPDLFEMAIQEKTLWFDGYNGEETVLIDDYEGELYLTTLLKTLDVYLRRVPIKGAFTWMEAKRIILTTNTHPSRWYSWQGRENKEDALRRRFIDYGYIVANTRDNIMRKVNIEKYWPIDQSRRAKPIVYEQEESAQQVPSQAEPLMTITEALIVQPKPVEWDEWKALKVTTHIFNCDIPGCIYGGEHRTPMTPQHIHTRRGLTDFSEYLSSDDEMY